MELKRRHWDFLLLLSASSIVFGVLATSISWSSQPPVGAFFMIPAPDCCKDCGCEDRQVCLMCPSCVFLGRCSQGLRTGDESGFRLMAQPRARAGQSFDIVAVIDSKGHDGGSLALAWDLPPGFYAKDHGHTVIDPDTKSKHAVSKTIYVREHVAQQQHIVRARLYDEHFKDLAFAEIYISVYW